MCIRDSSSFVASLSSSNCFLICSSSAATFCLSLSVNCFIFEGGNTSNPGVYSLPSNSSVLILFLISLASGVNLDSSLIASMIGSTPRKAPTVSGNGFPSA